MPKLGKAKLLNASFISAFTNKAALWESLVLEARLKGCSKEDAPLVEMNQVKEYLSQMDTPKLIGPDETHSQVLRKLAAVSVRSLSKISEWSQ